MYSSVNNESQSLVLERLEEYLVRTAKKLNTTKTSILNEARSIDPSHWYKIFRGQSRLSPQKFAAIKSLLVISKDELKQLDGLFEEYLAQTPIDGRTLRRSGWLSSKSSADATLDRICLNAGISTGELFAPDAFDHTINTHVGYLDTIGEHEQSIRNGAAIITALENRGYGIEDRRISIVISHILLSACGRGDKRLSRYLMGRLDSLQKGSRDPFLAIMYEHNHRKVARAFSGHAGLVRSDQISRKLVSLFEEFDDPNYDLSHLYQGIMAISLKSSLDATGTHSSVLQSKLDRYISIGTVAPRQLEVVGPLSVGEGLCLGENFDQTEQVTSEIIYLMDRTPGHYGRVRLDTRLLQARTEIGRLRDGNPRKDSKDAAIGYIWDAKRIARELNNSAKLRYANEMLASIGAL